VVTPENSAAPPRKNLVLSRLSKSTSPGGRGCEPTATPTPPLVEGASDEDAANAVWLGASSARGRATREGQDAAGASPDDAAKRVEGVPDDVDIGRVREVPFRAGAVRFRIRLSDRTPRAPRPPPRVPRRLVYETLSPTTASASSDLAPGGVPACGRVTRFARGSAKAALDDAID
jgi:hypothetical protein